MNLYRFLSNHIETHYIVAENGKAAVEAVEATGSLYDMIFLEAEEKALPGGSVAKLVIVPAAPAAISTPAQAWKYFCGTGDPPPPPMHSTCSAAAPVPTPDAEKDARIAALERKLAELTAAAEPCSKSPPGASALCKLRTVLAAQRGEKKEAKP